MYLLGFDIGSSSVKVSLVEGNTGKCVATAFSPQKEMKIIAHKNGWAEQEPQQWWDNLKTALNDVLISAKVEKEAIKAIGISYQMHGLVLLDKNGDVLRPSIIWCDSRAVEIGNNAMEEIGKEKCLDEMLNSPGNFTASKLRWVKENEPEIYNRIHKIMLPGDYIAYKLSGNINTTISGLSEGILWDFKNQEISKSILTFYGIDSNFIPEIVPTFAEHGKISAETANELNLSQNTVLSYRAGDQPNNAFSLNVLKPGEIAATAGTSGVVYGISDQIKYDPQSRVNTFAHVNYSKTSPRLGVLLCVNGTGILNSWTKHNIANGIDYPEMNQLALQSPIGSDGLSVLPFGNGAERMLGNQNPGATFAGLNFNIHNKSHLLRAVQEGIVFSFKYGMDIMEETGIQPSVIKAGNANMFLSPIFRETLSSVSGATIELYNTDGAIGAAKGAGVGSGFYQSFDEAFQSLQILETIEPNKQQANANMEAYEKWIIQLNKLK